MYDGMERNPEGVNLRILFLTLPVLAVVFLVQLAIAPFAAATVIGGIIIWYALGAVLYLLYYAGWLAIAYIQGYIALFIVFWILPATVLWFADLVNHHHTWHGFWMAAWRDISYAAHSLWDFFVSGLVMEYLVQPLADWLGPVVGPVYHQVADWLGPIFHQVLDWIKDFLHWVEHIAQSIYAWVVELFR